MPPPMPTPPSPCCRPTASPCFKYYDKEGGAGKVINGFSGYGVSLYVPASQLDEAKDLLASRPVEEETEEHA